LRIKICGITTVEDACQAAALGADAIGLNFHPPSPRYLAPAAALPIIRRLPLFVEPVGVFTDMKLMRAFAGEADEFLRTLQWHADPEELLRQPLIRNYGHLIVAFTIKDRASLDRITPCVKEIRKQGWPLSAILIDGYQRGLLGGTGQTAPWAMLAGFDPGVPLILAGGLTPENVAEAVRLVRPYAVDVASGVESSPGRKDADKMKRFIDNARAAGG